MEQSEYRSIYNLENNFWWYIGLHELVEHFVKSYYLHKGRQLTIFDAGCGTGRMLEILSKYGTTSGIDFAPEAVAFCKMRGISNVTESDLNTWTNDNCVYDVLYSLDVLYHRNIIDDSKIMQEFYKALKPGGLLILNLAAFDILFRNHDRIVHTARRYTIKKLKTSLSKAGFKITFINYRLPPLFIIILLKKCIEKIKKHSEASSDLSDINPLVNKLLLLYVRFENVLHHLRIPLHLGSSVFLVATKP